MIDHWNRTAEGLPPSQGRWGENPLHILLPNSGPKLGTLWPPSRGRLYLQPCWMQCQFWQMKMLVQLKMPKWERQGERHLESDAGEELEFSQRKGWENSALSIASTIMRQRKNPISMREDQSRENSLQSTLPNTNMRCQRDHMPWRRREVKNRTRESRHRKDQAAAPEGEPIREINTIVGGPHVGGNTQNV